VDDPDMVKVPRIF